MMDRMSTRRKLQALATAYVVSGDTQTSLFTRLARDLNEISGQTWGWHYIYNVWKGYDRMRASKRLKKAVDKLYAVVYEKRGSKRPPAIRIKYPPKVDPWAAYKQIKMKTSSEERYFALMDYIREKASGQQRTATGN